MVSGSEVACLACLPLALVVAVVGLSPPSSLHALLVAAPVLLFGFLGAVFLTRHPLSVELRKAMATIRRRMGERTAAKRCSL